ncbi:SGNH/GDSL hydrolase family protein [Paraconexibacter antarcticus]|uniref:SGNH/GDSL hydrolase family protein n=1 Tax=Paraconexibacter antarcticus TaxID=2949664 RepID=A0ABY5DU12_9ACTN|nr:SGNH/GDSL hydrolase family protein [Paraconexibacter antarcticus]UTI64140.1 SGNH/GDSL hydrolase family protein [Paraconexibacter antarcticus]
MRRALTALACAAAAAVALGTAGCGSSDGTGGATATGGPAASVPTVTAPVPTDPTVNPTPRPQSGDVLVAALGDSITAGSPLYDPDPAVRARIGSALDPRSQYEYWFHAAHPRYRFRNCGIFGQRTDEIAARLDACAKGAQVVVVQGGINDIAQGRSVDDAARNLRGTYVAARRLGLKVVAVEVLPWNNGYPRAAPLIAKLNGLIHAAAAAEGVPVAPWFRALEDPQAPGRMAKALTIDGDHPSVAGYERLADALPLP